MAGGESVNGLTVVIPTQGRHTLPRCLESMLPEHHGGYQAEVMVVADTHSPLLSDVRAIAREYGATYREHDANTHHWGYPQLQYGYGRAGGNYVMNIGDDDVYVPGAFHVIRAAIAELESPRPLLFRALMHPSVSRPCGKPITLWWERGRIERSFVTGQNLVAPNVPERLGAWRDDFSHLDATVNLWGGLVEWREEVVCRCY